VAAATDDGLISAVAIILKMLTLRWELLAID
jgi:hypothetical protein